MAKQLTLVNVLALVLVLVIGIGLGSFFESMLSDKDDKFLVDNWKLSEHEHLLIQANDKARNLQAALDKSEGDKSDLLDQIVLLKRKNNDLTVLLSTSSTLSSGGASGSLTVTNPVDCESPDPYEHKYQYENGLVVGDYAFDGETHSHVLYDLKFQSSIVVGDKDTSVITKMATAYDDEAWVEIPVEANIVTITDHDLIAPNISLGAAVMAPVFDVQPSLTLSWLHPTKKTDALSLKVGGTSSSYHVGVDVLSYNLGEHIPVFTDLWLSAGFVQTQYGAQGALTLGSKF